MKFRSFLIYAICLVVLVSCGGKKKKLTDDGLLTEEELVAVLVEIHMLDATIATYNSINKTAVTLSPVCYDSLVYSQHECNDSIFKKSLEYYTLEGRIKDIYDDVVDSLNTLKAISEQENRQK